MFLNRTLFFLAFLLPAVASAQVDDNPADDAVQQKVEILSENSEDESTDVNTLLDALEIYSKHPLNLNQATRKELESLQILNDLQINSFLIHRERTGDLLSIYELQSIKGFDLPTIFSILPYVTVKEKSLPFHWKDLFKGDHMVIARVQRVLEHQEGYKGPEDTVGASPGSYYLGPPEKLYTRYRYTYGQWLSAGITGEKDAGEAFSGKGMDFYSAHLFLRTNGLVRSVAIGDFQAQFGQGLTFWSGLGFGKSPDAVSVKRSGQGIRPYTSVDENLFLRGAAVEFGHKKWELTLFGSHKKIDAGTESILDSLNQDDVVVTSFLATGFHRTPSELAKKGVVNETVSGGNISFKSNSLQAGITAVQTWYDQPVARSLSLYNQFEFNATQNLNAGIDYSWVRKNFNFFGEAARSSNGGLAISNGLVASLDPRFNVSFLIRNFDRDYHALRSNSFSENTRPANEFGIFTGINMKLGSKWSLNGYYDHFRFPWLRYRVDAPSAGSDYLAQLAYTPFKRAEFYIRYRLRQKPQNADSDANLIDVPVPLTRENLRFNASLPVSASFTLRSRIEFSRFNNGRENQENGYMIYQDLVYRPVMSKLSFAARYALFNTDGYESRIYAYEHDVLYAYSIPGFFDRGTRAYLMLRYGLLRNTDIWLRAARTFYYNRNSIGSGTEEINGDTRTEIKLQVRVKF